MKMTLVLTGLLAVALIGYAPSSARAADEEHNVTLRDLPQNVQDAIRHEAGQDRIDHITQVTNGERVYYRVQIQRGNGEQIVKVNNHGELMAAENTAGGGGGAGDGRAVRTAEIPERAREAIRKQMGRGELPQEVTEVTRDGRRFYIVSTDKPFRVTEDGALFMPERVLAFKDLPRSVQDTFTRQMGERTTRGERAREVSFDGTTYYVIEYADANGRERTLAVDRDGRVAQQPALMSLVGGAAPDPGQLKAMDFSNLPGPVKATVGAERRNHDLAHVYEVSREGKTYWVADIEEQGGIRRIRVDGDGRIISESKIPY